MNLIGARRLGLRQFVLSILLCGVGIVFAQDEAEPPTSGQEVKAPAVDLVYESLDLTYPSEALVVGAIRTGGDNAGLTGGAVDLKSQVVDLVAQHLESLTSAQYRLLPTLIITEALQEAEALAVLEAKQEEAYLRAPQMVARMAVMPSSKIFNHFSARLKLFPINFASLFLHIEDLDTKFETRSICTA